MLKKINSFLGQSSVSASSAKKCRPAITLNDNKQLSASATDYSAFAALPGPAQSANTVKIYVSYDSGFEVERQMLWEDVLPRLRTRVESLALDVQLVDMPHLGALPPAAECHLDGYSHLCHFDMITDCHRVSSGPFFLCLVGDDYGTVPVPVAIEETEFRQLRSEIPDNSEDIKLLDQWYVLDEQYLPPSFLLQSPSRYFQHLNASVRNRDSNNAEETTAAELEEGKAWSDIQRRLVEMLQRAATTCFIERNQSLNDLQRRTYFYSKIHQELELALSLEPPGVIVISRTSNNQQNNNIGTEKESKASKPNNPTAKKSDLQQKKEQQLETLLRSADKAGQHRSFTAIGSRRTCDQPTPEDDDSVAEAYRAEFRRLVLAALIRSVRVGQQQQRSSMQRRGDEWPSIIDHKTAVCLYDGGGGGGYKLTTPVDVQVRRAIDEDVQSEGGHRAVLLQGAEGTGRTTALRRFVQFVAELSVDLPPPIVVARRVSWPGRTAVDLLHEDRKSTRLNSSH